MPDLEQRVAAGAALLDRERPGWWEEVDTGRLDMWSTCGCVLGQLDGWYSNGVRNLWPQPDHEYSEALAHGFDVYPESESYDDLDRLWLAAIAERAESVGPTAEEWAGQHG